MTLTVRLAWPPALFSLPDVGRVPDQAPLAVHEVALVEDQVSAVVPLEATDVGKVDNVTMGAGLTMSADNVTVGCRTGGRFGFALAKASGKWHCIKVQYRDHQ